MVQGWEASEASPERGGPDEGAVFGGSIRPARIGYFYPGSWEDS